MKKRLSAALGLLMSGVLLLSACSGAKPADQSPASNGGNAPATSEQVKVMHYFSDTLGQKAFAEVLKQFEAENNIAVTDNPMEHEAFKSTILVSVAGNNPPDAFSYWAGSKVQFIVDSQGLRPIDDLWQANNLDDVFPKGLVAAASEYDGKKYLVPLNYHYVGMFYNPEVMKSAGITEMPTTWAEFEAVLEKLKQAGVAPIALGSKERWPAQFWFDYLLLRTAGPDYRAKLMDGEASYTDPEVQQAMELWADLVNAGYFAPDANAYDWTDAADMVAKGEAAMTLMGTWITGYWNGNDKAPVTDYDFFAFPVIDPKLPVAALGPVDGFVIAQKAANPVAAEKLLAHLTKPEVQALWAAGQGALAPNTQVDPATFNEVMQRAGQVVAEADAFAFNYDLATTPPMADGGLNMFAQFMNNPNRYMDYLQQVQKVAEEVFQ